MRRARRLRARATLLALALAAAALPARGDEPAPTPADDTAPARPYPTVGLALSGGGARGFAHVGVLRALEECGLHVDAVAGTSMGAFVGALYALGYAPDEIQRIVTRPDWYDVMLRRRTGSRLETDWSLLELDVERGRLRVPTGLVGTDAFEERLAFLLLERGGTTDFTPLVLPYRAVATDLETGEAVVIGHGSLATAVRASMTVPGILPPAEREGRVLIDGGVADNLPVDVARTLGADVVIAVDVSTPLRKRDRIRTFVHVIDQTISFRMAERTAVSRARADLLIVPCLDGLSAGDFEPERAAALVRAGEAAGREACGRVQEVAGDAVRFDGRREPPGQIDRVRLRRVEYTGASTGGLRLARRLFGPLPDDGVVGLDELALRLAAVRSAGIYDRVAIDVSAADDDAAADADAAGTGATDPAPAPRLRITLRESPPLRFRLGARYDEKYDALGRIALTHRRTVGPVRGLTADVVFGNRDEESLEARHDGLFGTAFLAAARLDHARDFDQVVVDGGIRGDLRHRTAGGEATLGHTLGRSGALLGGLRAERVEADDRSRSLALDPGEEDPTDLVLALARLSHDTTGGSATPRAGHRLRAEAAVATTALGSDREYGRGDAVAAFWHPLGRRVTLVARAHLAGSLGGDLPVWEEVAVGGNAEAPGYDIDEFRAERLASLGLGLRVDVVKLPAALGHSLYVLGRGGGVWLDPAPSLEAAADEDTLAGGAVGAGIDTRVGPVEVVLGWGNQGRQRVSIEAGPRF